MLARGTIHLASLALLAVSGCSLLVSAQLEDKPSETGGAGGTGGDGSTANTSTTTTSSGAKASSVTSSSNNGNGGPGSGGPGSSSGGGNCPGDMTTCAGTPPVCTNLKTDPMNCGACFKVCSAPTHCSNGACK